MRLTRYRTAILALPLILAGCLNPGPVEPPALAFCDAEEPRRFSQAEIEWRAANAPWNLRRDYKTNETGTRECGWFD